MSPVPYILIDNCILINLVSPNTYSELLKWLKQLADEKKIVLLAPDTLLPEWNRHKGDKRKKVVEGLSSEADIQSSVQKVDEVYVIAIPL